MNEWVNKLNAVESIKYPDKWDVDGDVILSNGNLTKLPLQFGIVTGSFWCYNNKLTSLEGAPREVTGHFSCSSNQLETLEGAPQKVGRSFYCTYNNNLETLEGAPQKVGESFHCYSNKLKTLEGVPQKVGGDLYFYDNPLEQFNDLMGVDIKNEICVNNTPIKALHNTNLDVLEYTIQNHKYWFVNDEIKKEFLMYLEQIVIKKRLESSIYLC